MIQMPPGGGVSPSVEHRDRLSTASHSTVDVEEGSNPGHHVDVDEARREFTQLERMLSTHSKT